MFKTTLFLCSLPAVFSIIVTDPPPPPSETDYKYSYDIEDPTTGDSKSQHEIRQGDVVSGAYSVVGPDGTKRIVEYTADSKHGFKAVLREEPATKPISQPKDQYFVKPRVQTPAYNLVQAKLPIPYVKENSRVDFFTPANEIKDDRIFVENGKYFEPAAE